MTKGLSLTLVFQCNQIPDNILKVMLSVNMESIASYIYVVLLARPRSLFQLCFMHWNFHARSSQRVIKQSQFSSILPFVDVVLISIRGVSFFDRQCAEEQSRFQY